MEGKEVTAAYSSVLPSNTVNAIIPIPDAPVAVTISNCAIQASDIKRPDIGYTPLDTPIGSATSAASLASAPEEDYPEANGEIDLTSVSTKGFKRHIKVKTTPNSSTTSPFRGALKVETDGSDAGSMTETSKSNLSDLLPKHSTKSLTGIGDFIPSVEQYKRLLEQLDLVINCLPAELVMNARDHNS